MLRSVARCEIFYTLGEQQWCFEAQCLTKLATAWVSQHLSKYRGDLSAGPDLQSAGDSPLYCIT